MSYNLRNVFRLVFSTALSLCIANSLQAGTIRYVDVNASGPTHNGSSWCSAFTDLQNALDVAIATDEIRIADGEYRPDRGTGNRELSFQLKSGVEIYGGYAGCNATNPDARNIASFETRLSGDLVNNDGPNFTNYSENSYHVVAAINVNSKALLDGVTVSGGNADGPNFGPHPSSKDQGSGINNYWSNAHYENCTLRNNYSANHGAFNDHGGATLINCTFEDNESGMWGGGLFVAPNIAATVTGCKFINNHTVGIAGGGGAIANGGNSVFTNCLFSNNSTDLNGGGFYNHSSAKPTFNGCTFSDNYAEFGGGLYNQTGSNLAFTGCLFSSNVARQYGGGIWGYSNPMFFTDCTFSDNSTILAYGGGLYFGGNGSILTRCTFSGNTSLQGAGLYITSGTITLEYCTFYQNHATGSGQAGGGIFCRLNTNPILRDCVFNQNTAINGTGGGMYVFNDSTPILIRCTFIGNHARVAGGFYSGQGNIEYLINCKFINNIADAACGGAYFYRDDPTLVNCIFNRNITNNVGGGIVSAFSNTKLINCTLYNNSARKGGGLFTESSDRTVGRATVTITNSILWGNTDTDVDGTTLSAQIHNAVESQPESYYSCVQGWDGSLIGSNNIFVNPLFVDPNGADNVAGTEDDNFRLKYNSPAMDVGDDDAITADIFDLDRDGNITESIPIDLAGDLRIFFDGVDMGAFEQGDCNSNGIHDSVEIAGGTSNDINLNMIPDVCEEDCNQNGLPDSYEVTVGLGTDCNNNVILDACEMDALHGVDCNSNNVLDACDIADGTSFDVNNNCIPDECNQYPMPLAEEFPINKNRFISFMPVNYSCNTAIRITLSSLHHPDPPMPDSPDFSVYEGKVRWAGSPDSYAENDSGQVKFWASSLQCEPFFTDWSSVSLLHLFGDAIVPSSTYLIEVVGDDCVDLNDPNCYSDTLEVRTGRWGDIVSPIQNVDGANQPTIDDVVAAVGKWLGKLKPIKAQTLLQNNVPDPSQGVSIDDIVMAVNAWLSAPYPYAGPASCTP